MAKRIASKTGAKEALGSGIDVLFTKKLDQAIAENPEKVVKDLSSHFALVPIDQIESNPDQPRKDFDPEALQELADSIKVHGIIQPLTVRRLNAKQYQIISGERRWRAWSTRWRYSRSWLWPPRSPGHWRCSPSS